MPLQKRMATLLVIKQHNSYILGSHAMVKEVACSYGELMHSSGFEAAEKSRAYAAVDQEFRKLAVTKSLKMSAYLHIDYQNAVVVQDLLRQPSVTAIALFALVHSAAYLLKPFITVV